MQTSETVVGGQTLPSPSPVPPQMTHDDVSAAPVDTNNVSSDARVAQLERDVERLQSLLFTTERKLDASRQEVDALRATADSSSLRFDNQTRIIESLRREIDNAASRAADADTRIAQLEAELVRLRADSAEWEREAVRRGDEADQAQQKMAEETVRRTTLERVVMGLRRRVALAEEAASKSQSLKDAVAARRAAESALVDARTEAERMRARLASVDALRERAETAERAERSLRQRFTALEREIEGREGVIRQTRAERQKLTQMMTLYERELAQKEASIAALRRSAPRGRRPATNNMTQGHAGMSSRGGSATDLRVEDDNMSSHSEDSGLSNGRDGHRNAQVKRHGGHDEEDNEEEGDENSGEWNGLNGADGQLRSFGDGHTKARERRRVEASPLLREVEEAHAQLQAAFEDRHVDASPGGADDGDELGDGIDLVERVRKLEATFGALANHH